MKEHPFAPQGAPQRPVWASLWRRTLLCLMPVCLTFGLIKQGFNLTIATVVGVSLFGLVCWHVFSLWRELNSTSWYEMKSIEMPVLPFKDTIDLRPIIFEKDSVTLEYGTCVPYHEIGKVEVRCKGIHFRGLELTLANGKTERIGNYDSDGEPARTAIVILRHKVSHAQFAGPPWIEQGWIPRMGFSYPDTGS